MTTQTLAVPFLSQPRVVVKVIEDAAKHASGGAGQ